MTLVTRERTYIDAADAAKLVRKSLREAFPGVAFKVRTDKYAGGASVDVRWIDGPTEDQVKAVTGRFAGSYFDGMIDYAGSIYATLDGQPVRFQSDYVPLHRDYSRRFLDATIEQAYTTRAELAQAPWPDVAESDGGYAYIRDAPLIKIGNDYAQWYIMRLAQMTSECASEPSPTAARVQVVGSDDYSRRHGSGYTFGQ